MQQITPLEIRQKSFEKSFRGYRPDEVNAFLHSLAYAWEKLIAQIEEFDDQLEASKKEVKRLQEVENALLRTIKDAEIAARNIVDQAQREADLKIKEAEVEAARIIHEVQEKARAAEAESEHHQIYQKEQMERELERNKKTIHEAEVYRDTLLQKFQHLGEDILARSQLIRSSIIPSQNDQKESPEVLEKMAPEVTEMASSSDATT